MDNTNQSTHPNTQWRPTYRRQRQRSRRGQRKPADQPASISWNTNMRVTTEQLKLMLGLSDTTYQTLQSIVGTVVSATLERMKRPTKSATETSSTISTDFAATSPLQARANELRAHIRGQQSSLDRLRAKLRTIQNKIAALDSRPAPQQGCQRHNHTFRDAPTSAPHSTNWAPSNTPTTPAETSISRSASNRFNLEATNLTAMAEPLSEWEFVESETESTAQVSKRSLIQVP